MKKNHNKNFKTPDNYFEGFNERLMARLDKESDAQEGSLIPKSDGFAVPEGYFNGIHESLENRLNQKDTKVVSLFSYKKYYYAAASIAAIFVLVAVFMLNSGQDKVAFDDLASDDIESYFEYNDFELSSYELAEVFNLEDVSVGDMTENSLEDAEILDYLDENLDGIEDLNLSYEELE